MKTFPHFKFEKEYWEKNMAVLGIDEAGRGAFAGPLAVGGVIFHHNLANKVSQLGVNDSKLLSARKREQLYEEIKKHALFSHVELVPLEIIEKLGIGKATTYGMQQVHTAALRFHRRIFALIDAFRLPDVVHQKAIIRGDQISLSIAASSILAKVERDRYMEKLAEGFANYGWEKNKGYGTLDHRAAIKKFGLTEFHRTVFCRKAFVEPAVI